MISYWICLVRLLGLIVLQIYAFLREVGGISCYLLADFLKKSFPEARFFQKKTVCLQPSIVPRGTHCRATAPQPVVVGTGGTKNERQ
jgi:hypothetical protein